MYLDTERLKARLRAEIKKVEAEKVHLEGRIAELELLLARCIEGIEALQGVERTAASLGMSSQAGVAGGGGSSSAAASREARVTPPPQRRQQPRSEPAETTSARVSNLKMVSEPVHSPEKSRSDRPSAPENLDVSVLEEVMEATRPSFSRVESKGAAGEPQEAIDKLFDADSEVPDFLRKYFEPR